MMRILASGMLVGTSACATVAISSDPTQNMNCVSGVCTPTATNAVLNVRDLKHLRIRNDKGRMVPLGTVADVEDKQGPVMVVRYNMYPAAVINGILADPDEGPDSPLYEAIGYTRRSERKTGLTRKRKDLSKK